MLVSLDEFCRRHLLHLEADQARHNLMLGLLSRAKKGGIEIRLWSFGDGTRCALQTPPKGIALGDLTAEDLQQLAAEAKNLDFRGCTGSGDIPSAFARALGNQGVPMELGMPQRIYVLQTEPVYPGAEGEGRAVTPADLDLYLDWTIQFCAEAVPHEPLPKREELAKVAFDRPVFFWELNRRPVSMASRSRETKDGSNISLVYTPPQFRGKGFGGSVTAFTCEDIFRSGKKLAFLYTDLRNPTSNKVYQKIGFKPWCEASTFVRKS